MGARDGSEGFDFEGTYDEIDPNKTIRYTLDDGRKVVFNFTSAGNSTEMVETFAVENSYPVDMQRTGWQAILDNFKKYTESQSRKDS